MAELLWGDRGDAQARSSLRHALVELRHAVNKSHDVVLSDRDHLWVQADTLIEEPGHLNKMGNDVFDDLDHITPEFDEWLAYERSRRASAQIATLRAEAEKLLANGMGAQSLPLIEEILEIEPCTEEALCLAMEAEFQCAHAGVIAERYRVTAERMKADLDVEPSTQTRLLRDRLISRLGEQRQAAPLSESDYDYFAGRAEEERVAALQATSKEARHIHEILAERYGKITAALR